LISVKIGDIIYIETKGYLTHGRDDVRGGKATVTKVYKSISGGEKVNFVRVKEVNDSGYNWDQFLAQKQSALKKEFGEQWAASDPDMHPNANPPNYGW